MALNNIKIREYVRFQDKNFKVEELHPKTNEVTLLIRHAASGAITRKVSLDDITTELSGRSGPSMALAGFFRSPRQPVRNARRVLTARPA